jgi:hypothetical protein
MRAQALARPGQHRCINPPRDPSFDPCESESDVGGQTCTGFTLVGFSPNVCHVNQAFSHYSKTITYPFDKHSGQSSTEGVVLEPHTSQTARQTAAKAAAVISAPLRIFVCSAAR